MELGLSSSRVIVTGGASNVGRGIVHGFAREGSRILIADLDEAQAHNVAAEALRGGAAGVDVIVLDLAVPEAGPSVVARAIERFGGVYVLVNNVGWTYPNWSEKECLSFARAVPLRELPSATDVAAATVWFASRPRPACSPARCSTSAADIRCHDPHM